MWPPSGRTYQLKGGIQIPDTLAFQPQSPDSLKYSLVIGPVPDLRDFHVLAVERRQFGPITLVARIVGASHVITYEVNGVTATEVFACLPLGNEWQDYPAIDGQPQASSLGSYCHTLLAEAEADGAAAMRRLARMADSELFMEYRFPTDIAETKYDRTVLAFRQVGPDGLLVETAHEYTSSGLTIFTVTTLEPEGCEPA